MKGLGLFVLMGGGCADLTYWVLRRRRRILQRGAQATTLQLTPATGCCSVPDGLHCLCWVNGHYALYGVGAAAGSKEGAEYVVAVAAPPALSEGKFVH